MSRKTNWLKQNYDKLLLVLSLLLLLGSALFLVLQIKQQGDEPLARPPAVGEFLKADRANTKNVEQQLLTINQPKQMEVGRGIMGDELRVSCVNSQCGKPISYAALVCPFCAAKQPEVVDPEKVSTRADGIPDVWKKKHGFDVLDANVANADPDGDGFTTLEEYRSGTDPHEAKSHPDIASKLRVVAVRQHPFKVRFMGMLKTTETKFQLNLRSGKTVFAKVGEEAEGYRLTAYEPTAADGEVLVVEKGPEKTRLVKGRDVQQFELIADLVSLLDHARFSNKAKDDVIKIRGNEYKIVDIKSDAVRMRDSQSARGVVVPLLTPAEHDEVFRASAPQAAAEPVAREQAQTTANVKP